MCLGFYRWAKNILGWKITISREQSELPWHWQKCIGRRYSHMDSGWVFRKHYDIICCCQKRYSCRYINVLSRALLWQKPPNAQSLLQRTSKSRRKMWWDWTKAIVDISAAFQNTTSLWRKSFQDFFLVCASCLRCNLLIFPTWRIWEGLAYHQENENILYLSAHQ